MVKEWRGFVQKGDCVNNPYFKHKSLLKYTRVARGQDRGKIKSMRSSAGEEGHDAMCAGGERHGTRPLRPPCCTV